MERQHLNLPELGRDQTETENEVNVLIFSRGHGGLSPRPKTNVRSLAFLMSSPEKLPIRKTRDEHIAWLGVQGVGRGDG